MPPMKKLKESSRSKKSLCESHVHPFCKEPFIFLSSSIVEEEKTLFNMLYCRKLVPVKFAFYTESTMNNQRKTFLGKKIDRK